MRLDGKVTLITGVSEYMGPAFTRTFTDAGDIVITQDRTRAEAEPHAEYARSNPGASTTCSNRTSPRSAASLALPSNE
jgi:NAD(P)-dependent dehydrogenase (short-subunit alcohol dehydrogenase family)